MSCILKQLIKLYLITGRGAVAVVGDLILHGSVCIHVPGIPHAAPSARGNLPPRAGTHLVPSVLVVRAKKYYINIRRASVSVQGCMRTRVCAWHRVRDVVIECARWCACVGQVYIYIYT